MSFKTGKRMATAGVLAVILGLSLMVTRIAFGEIVLAIGIIISLVGVGGMFRHELKRPVFCPQCGATLSTMGKGTNKYATCAECGTWVDVIENYVQRKYQ